MPDTDNYDPSAGNEQLAEVRQKTEDAKKAQDAANAQGAKDAEDVTKDAADAGKTPTGLIGKVLGSFKRGGEVSKTGSYKLHKGEEVLPAGRASEYRQLFEKRGQEGKHKWGK